MFKIKVVFLEGGFFTANQLLKAFLIALIGWIKAGFSKTDLCTHKH